MSEVIEGVRETFKRIWHVLWTSMIGLVIGVVPGAGASIAAFVAYQQSQTFSKTPELYGTGHIEGLIAPESANNGVTAGTLVPLLAIGIPGGATAAIMLVVMTYHGVTVGPDLFTDKPEFAYGAFAAMAVTYIIMIFTIFPLARYMSRVTMVPTIYIVPLIVSFTLVGSFVPPGLFVRYEPGNCVRGHRIHRPQDRLSHRRHPDRRYLGAVAGTVFRPRAQDFPRGFLGDLFVQARQCALDRVDHFLADPNVEGMAEESVGEKNSSRKGRSGRTRRHDGITTTHHTGER